MMVTDTPGTQQVTYAGPPATVDTPPAHRIDLSMLSPSARTSFTRVDTMVNDEDDGDDVHADEDDDVEPTESNNASQDNQEAPPVPQTPQVALTFLLMSGKRRSMTFEPETTVGRTKELVWNAWPKDWQDERPPAPSYLRILYLGKILQDEDTLTKVGFPTNIPSPAGQANSSSNPPIPTVVHLSIRSCPPPGAKDAPKKRGMRRNSGMLATAYTGGCPQVLIASFRGFATPGEDGAPGGEPGSASQHNLHAACAGSMLGGTLVIRSDTTPTDIGTQIWGETVIRCDRGRRPEDDVYP
ncbi:hypothetical protein NM688_g8658 [Phlebia brevispora]|uniref:Uncharacterized protein n=1 Tax=Phlebia brevispora TaxID=194682 RepID=A0ACC1RSS4_9APHY|nr:hypothetical protein NM688_g8658 [Phlebia brevispora]